MRRIALLSDIHGNAPALDAVLADIDAAGIGERYCLGDLIGYGPDPDAVIERVRASRVPTIQGNYDEGVASRRGSCGCYYATDAAREDGDRSYAFTDTALDPVDAEWLLGLPYEIRFEHEGARVLLVHGSPRKTNEYLLLDRTEEQLARLAVQAEADVVCHGHIHIPYHRSFEVPADAAPAAGPPAVDQSAAATTLHYVSSGSVGKPKDGDARAAWVEIVLGAAEETGAAAAADGARARIGTTGVSLGVVVHRVAYDIDAVAERMRERGLPETLVEALRRA